MSFHYLLLNNMEKELSKCSYSGQKFFSSLALFNDKWLDRKMYTQGKRHPLPTLLFLSEATNTCWMSSTNVNQQGNSIYDTCLAYILDTRELSFYILDLSLSFPAPSPTQNASCSIVHQVQSSYYIIETIPENWVTHSVKHYSS